MLKIKWSCWMKIFKWLMVYLFTISTIDVIVTCICYTQKQKSILLPQRTTFRQLTNNVPSKFMTNDTQRIRHKFGFTINEHSVCSQSKGRTTIELLVIITTSYEHRSRRSSLRNSWLSCSQNNTSELRYIFILGQTENKTLLQSVIVEEKQYQDIVVANFKDSYKNLTLKTITGFHWANEQCQHARFVMKTDDDVYVNIPGIMEILDRKDDSFSLGYPNRGTKPLRTVGHKWYMSYEEYPSSTYPDYFDGLGYILSMTLLKRILNIYPFVRFISLEDVFIGLCLKSLGYRYKTETYYIFLRTELAFPGCFYKHSNVIAAHGVTESRMITIWKTRCTETKPLSRRQRLLLQRNQRKSA